MNDSEIRAIMALAEKTNTQRDIYDKQAGFGSPTQGPPDITLRTVMMALHSAMATDDWNCVAEAQSMLSVLEFQIRPKKGNGHPPKPYKPWLRNN